MRTIKFRGKTNAKLGSVWVFGYYVFCRGNHYILQDYNDAGYDERWETSDWIEVIPETVGQYIERKDKYGKEAYHNDIIISNGFIDVPYIIDWAKTGWGISHPKAGNPIHITEKAWDNFEIIGNKFDNPNLITS